MEPGGMRIPEDASSQPEYISPIGYSNSSRCGYCGTSGKSFSYYAKATSISPDFYQTLLDRCWRRSGTLMYRPDQRRSCCPHYTIRLDANLFKPSRAQRQTVNRFNRYVIGDSYAKEAARLHPKSRDQAKKRDNQFDLVERIHEAEHSQLQTPPEPAHQLQVTLEHNDFTEEKFAVYENYQQVVHKEEPAEISRAGFKRFLCASPLRRETMLSPDGHTRRLGSYHQCYRIDGKLVAIGVLDLLPDCVSSVYFLYDESIHEHAPGKLGALYEIALAIEEGYKWWYPGFYIHSCPKMRYKMDYAPQEILDPVALTWDLLNKDVLDLLDKKPFVSLAEERNPPSDAIVEMNNADDDLDSDDESAFLFNHSMPGVPPLSEVVTWDMEHISLRISANGPIYKTSNLVAWEDQTPEQWPGLRAGVCELIAAIGPDLMDKICLDFAPSG